MSEPESMMQTRDDASRGKGGKGKAIIKRSKTEASSRPQNPQPSAAGSRRSETRQPESGAEERRDPQMIAKIRQRAYGLYEASGCQDGHDVEHWLEAERQITGTPDRRES